ncbi:hypothetical protein ACFWOJ_37000 [Streptomyces sp. NPDC058439]
MQMSLAFLAAACGGAAGLLVQRAAYRFAVPPGEERRAACAARTLIRAAIDALE